MAVKGNAKDVKEAVKMDAKQHVVVVVDKAVRVVATQCAKVIV